MSKQQTLMAATIASAAGAIGVFLPWVSLSIGPISASANGFEANTGLLIFILAAVAAALAGLAWQGKSGMVPIPAKTQKMIGRICIVLAALLTLGKFFGDFGPASRGLGLYLTQFGTIAGAVFMFLGLKAGGGAQPTADGGGSSDGGTSDEGGDEGASGESSGDQA